MANKYHIAQLNIGKLLHPMEHPAIAGFKDNLEQINRLAERSQGFIWRLKDDSGNATHIQVFHDPLIIVNMSVWESVETLQSFVYLTEHKKFIQKRHLWFEKLSTPYMAIWWISEGHIPSLEEALDRLNHLIKEGESEYAFTFRNIYFPVK